MKKLIFLLLLAVGFLTIPDTVKAQVNLLYINGADSFYISLPKGTPKYIFKTDTFKLPGIFIEAAGVGKADSSNFLKKHYNYAGGTIYVSEYPVGNDTTGDGSIGAPLSTLDFAISNLADFYLADIQIKLDTGDYTLSKESFYRLMEIQTLGFYAIYIDGTYETHTTMIGKTQDPDNPFLYHTSNTWTPGELKEMFTLGFFNLPILDNGVDWVILASESNGDVGSTIINVRTNLTFEDPDHIAIAARTVYGRGGIEFRFLRAQGQNPNKSLRFGAVTPTQRFKFETCVLTALNFQNNNVSLDQCYLNSSKQGFSVNGFNCNLDHVIIEGDGGAADAGIETKEGGAVQASSVIIANYGIGIRNLGSTTIEANNSGQGIFMRDVATGFVSNPGMVLRPASWQTIALDNVDYLIEPISNYGVYAAFDTNNISGAPVIDWIKNDNGLRTVPKNNYNVFVRGINDVAGVDSSLYSANSDSANYADLAKRLELKFELASKTIYVTTTGNDTTGDGSIGNPYHTAAVAISKGFERGVWENVDITIDIGPGLYLWNWDSITAAFYNKVFLQGSSFTMQGATNTLYSGLTATPRSPEAYIYDITGSTFTQNELIGKFLSTGSVHTPIVRNETTYLFAPAYAGGTSIIENSTQIFLTDVYQVHMNLQFPATGSQDFIIQNLDIYAPGQNLQFLTAGALFEFNFCNFWAASGSTLFGQERLNFSYSQFIFSSKGFTDNNAETLFAWCVFSKQGSKSQYGIRKNQNYARSWRGVYLYNWTYALELRNVDLGFNLTNTGIVIDDCTTAFRLRNNTNIWMVYANIFLEGTITNFIQNAETIYKNVNFQCLNVTGTPTNWTTGIPSFMDLGNNIKINIPTIPTNGTATLTAGTVTVNTSAVTANSQILLTPQNVGTAQGSVYISARVAGTSFTITSTNVADDRLIAWQIVSQ